MDIVYKDKCRGIQHTVTSTEVTRSIKRVQIHSHVIMFTIYIVVGTATATVTVGGTGEYVIRDAEPLQSRKWHLITGLPNDRTN